MRDDAHPQSLQLIPSIVLKRMLDPLELVPFFYIPDMACAHPGM